MLPGVNGNTLPKPGLLTFLMNRCFVVLSWIGESDRAADPRRTLWRHIFFGARLWSCRGARRRGPRR